MTFTQISENMPNSSIATVVGSTTVLANIAGSLPTVINVIVMIYFILMIIHKVYQMRKEYRGDTHDVPF